MRTYLSEERNTTRQKESAQVFLQSVGILLQEACRIVGDLPFGTKERNEMGGGRGGTIVSSQQVIRDNTLRQAQAKERQLCAAKRKTSAIFRRVTWPVKAHLVEQSHGQTGKILHTKKR